MLEKGIIAPCDGLWSPPIVLAKKEDGSLRFCIELSKVERDDPEGIPSLADRGQPRRAGRVRLIFLG